MPVGSRAGSRRRCVNIGNLCVFSSFSPLSACSDPSAPLSKDFQKSLTTDAIQGVDIYHQLLRLRHGKHLADTEVELMMRTFAENLQSYDQVIEVGGNWDKVFLICLVDHLLLDARISTTAPGWSPPAQSWASTPARNHPRLYSRYIQRTEAISRKFPQFTFPISFHSYPIASLSI